MVPLVHGQWEEARILALGTVEQRINREGEQEARCTHLSYVTRLCSADAFIRLATLPTHERGTRGAGTVVAVADGASWLQELVDEQAPGAVRILDFPHAVGYLARAAQAAFGPGSREASVWLDVWMPTLKTGEPGEVIAALRRLPASTSDAATEKGTAVRYLTQRLEQIRYAHFQEQGYPIGSGAVESACKLVVEGRLKGSRGPARGCHWEGTNVSPMLALRGIACSDRWEEAWPPICSVLRSQVQTRRHARWQRRHPLLQPAPLAPRPQPKEHPKRIIQGRPTADHPWRNSHPFPNAWAWNSSATL